MEERNCEGCKNYKLLESNSNSEGKLTEVYSCKLWDCHFEPKETEADLIKKRLFELIYRIDELSVSRENINRFRITHYQNCDWLKRHDLSEEYCDWLKAHDLSEEYYNYMMERLKGDKTGNE